MATDGLKIETEDIQDAYAVKLDIFEGPLDLLLYLIRRDELDIYDIPVAHITTQYLAFLQQIQDLDLEQASDFILMAATLMRVKSQMMMPRQDIEGEESEGEDPREELVRRLLEYQQFKEISEWLGFQFEEQRDVFLNRAAADPEAGDGDAELRPVSLLDLFKVYKHVIDTVPHELVHQIVEERISIQECVAHVVAMLERRSRLRFYDLVEGGSRETLIATFIGILELLKSQHIRVQQARPFDDIWVEKVEDGPALDRPTIVPSEEMP
jgi:segregation and condensation protein A